MHTVGPKYNSYSHDGQLNLHRNFWYWMKQCVNIWTLVKLYIWNVHPAPLHISKYVPEIRFIYKLIGDWRHRSVTRSELESKSSIEILSQLLTVALLLRPSVSDVTGLSLSSVTSTSSSSWSSSEPASRVSVSDDVTGSSLAPLQCPLSTLHALLPAAGCACTGCGHSVTSLPGLLMTSSLTVTSSLVVHDELASPSIVTSTNGGLATPTGGHVTSLSWKPVQQVPDVQLLVILLLVVVTVVVGGERRRRWHCRQSSLSFRG